MLRRQIASFVAAQPLLRNINLLIRYMSKLERNGTVSICHMRATHDKEHNRRQVLEVVRRAKQEQSKVITTIGFGTGKYTIYRPRHNISKYVILQIYIRLL